MQTQYTTNLPETSPGLCVGITSPMRPKPKPAVYAASDLSRWPSDRGPIVALKDFRVPSDLLPNRLPRPQTIRAEAVFTVGGDFHLLARVRRDAGVTRLELTGGWDTVLDVPVHLSGLELASQVYSRMAAAFVTSGGRRHAREARN